MDDLIQFLGMWLPLRVDSVAVADPIVTIIGERWSLSLACPWQLVQGEIVLTAWDRSDVEDAIWDFVGRDVVEVRRAQNFVDPIFRLSGGIDLVVDADTDLDPWVLRVAGRTFVGAAQGPF